MKLLLPGSQPESVRCAVEACSIVFSALPGPFWIAGGAIRDLVLYGEHDTDWDLFFPSESAIGDTRAALSAADAKLSLENANVYKYASTVLGDVDLVRRTYPDAADCISSFDYTVACCAVTRDSRFLCHDDFFKHLSDRALVVNKLPHPLSSVRRLQKYIRKGFHICNAGVLELAKALKTTDLDKEQVFYVD